MHEKIMKLKHSYNCFTKLNPMKAKSVFLFAVILFSFSTLAIGGVKARCAIKYRMHDDTTKLYVDTVVVYFMSGSEMNAAQKEESGKCYVVESMRSVFAIVILDELKKIRPIVILRVELDSDDFKEMTRLSQNFFKKNPLVGGYDIDNNLYGIKILNFID
jgi:hypothetical protein